MLVNENNSNIFPIAGEAVKSRLDGGRVGLAIDDKEILL